MMTPRIEEADIMEALRTYRKELLATLTREGSLSWTLPRLIRNAQWVLDNEMHGLPAPKAVERATAVSVSFAQQSDIELAELDQTPGDGDPSPIKPLPSGWFDRFATLPES